MHRRILLILFTVFFLTSNFLYARKITLDKREHISINGDFDYFEDKEGVFTIQNIQGQNFIHSTKRDPSFGLTNSVYWIRFTEELPNTDLDLFKLELNNTLIEDLQFYAFDAVHKKYSLQKTGRIYPFNKRIYPLKSFVFDLPNDGAPHQYYIRVKSLYTMAFPIEFARYSALSEVENDRQLLFGFIFGLIFLVGLYNFLMYTFVREKVYLVYTLYAFIFGFYNFIFVGLDVQYLYPEAVYWPKISASFFAAISVLLGCQLSRMFLATKIHAKGIDKVLLAFIGVALILAIIPFFHISIGYKRIITLFPIVIFIPTIWAAIIRVRQGYFPAILYLCGWGLLGSSIVCYGLRSAQIIDSDIFTANSIPIGTVFEMIFLSTSLSYKFRLIKKENDEAKETKILHLEELKNLKDKANKELEQKVEERTYEVIQQKDELTVKNKHITDSINYAKRLQDSLLPNKHFIGSFFKDYFILYKPKDIISGDFYWFFKGEKHLYLVVADCTGHGVPGALMSMLGHSFLNEIIKENQSLSAGEVLKCLHEKVNIALSRSGDKQKVTDGMDVSLLKMNAETKEIEYSGAKRPLWLIKGEEIRIIKGSKFPIGGNQRGEDYQYETNSFIGEEGMCCYLFSDGYPDQFGFETGQKFMTKRFRTVLQDISLLPMYEQKTHLNQLFEMWRGLQDQTDDVLVVGIKL